MGKLEEEVGNCATGPGCMFWRKRLNRIKDKNENNGKRGEKKRLELSPGL